MTVVKKKAKSRVTMVPVKRGRKSKWKDEFYVRIYQLLKGGMSLRKIAPILGVEYNTLKVWGSSKPALKKAIKEGKTHKTRVQNVAQDVKDWVYGQLPLKYQKVWKKIERCYSRGGSFRRIQYLLNDEGETVKKYLFLHGLTTSNFNASAVLKQLGLTKNQLDRWIRDDKDFATLIDEVQWHMKNFFESKLIQLVKEGDPGAVMLVNKTRNRDRGYGEKMQVEHLGKVTHDHSHKISLDQLDLPPRIMRGILRAMRKAGVDDTGVIDADFTPPAVSELNGNGKQKLLTKET